MKLDMIATDFEKFVHNGSTIGSSIGLIGGTKTNPVWVQHGNLQEDNVLAEAATNPCKSVQEFIDCIHALNGELLSALPPGYSLYSAAWHEYPSGFFDNQPEAAREFGCSAEIQAWNGGVLRAPSPDSLMRTAGAHVHFSYDDPCMETTFNIIRMMDYLLGAWSVLHDSDTRRRTMYGRAGSCRVKEYGGEYRALSSFWIDDVDLIKEVYRRTELAVQHHDKLHLFQTVLNGKDLRKAINKYDTAQCRAVETEVMAIVEALC